MIASALIISAIAVYAIYIIHHLITQSRKYASINKLPGPSLYELLQVMFCYNSPYDKYQYLVNLTSRYGPSLKLQVKPFNPIVITADADVFNGILLSKDQLYRGKSHDLVKPFLGEAIGTTNKVDIWKRDRKICNLVFQSSNIAEFLPLVEKHTNKFLVRLKDYLGKVVDVQPLLHLYALDITFEFVTKHESNFVNDRNASYLNARITFLTTLSKRMYSVFLQNDILFRLSKYFKMRNDAICVMKRFTHDIIYSEKIRRKEASLQRSRLHIIDVLFANNFGMDELHDQIDTFIITGHDTTAETMCYALYELSRHSKVQEKLFQELISMIGENGEVTNETLKAMTYLQAVINETLRLHPVGPIIEKQLASDVEINGMYYPKGTRVMFSIIGIHTSPKYFENPDKFDPERFMPENADKLNKHSFVPFSVGPRNCIGKRFALLVLKYSVAKIIQQYEVFPDKNHTLKVLGELIAKSVTGVPIILKKRGA